MLRVSMVRVVRRACGFNKRVLAFLRFCMAHLCGAELGWVRPGVRTGGVWLSRHIQHVIFDPGRQLTRSSASTPSTLLHTKCWLMCPSSCVCYQPFMVLPLCSVLLSSIVSDHIATENWQQQHRLRSKYPILFLLFSCFFFFLQTIGIKGGSSSAKSSPHSTPTKKVRSQQQGSSIPLGTAGKSVREHVE